MILRILTLFPEMVMNGLNTSIIGRAMESGIVDIEAINIRDYAFNKHKSVDDYPYGGGAGMLMQAEPIHQAYLGVVEQMSKERKTQGLNDATEDTQVNDVAISLTITNEVATDYAAINESVTSAIMPNEVAVNKRPRVIYLSPQGQVFNQELAHELAKEEELIFLCGHYEGVDERVLDEIVTDHISIGDYVLTGGELPAMVMIDAITRLIPGVLNNNASTEFESFQDNLLEYPHYTRPEVWNRKRVPAILLSGHHANIEKWRRQQSLLRTRERRPDLLEKAELTEEEWGFLEGLS